MFIDIADAIGSHRAYVLTDESTCERFLGWCIAQDDGWEPAEIGSMMASAETLPPSPGLYSPAYVEAERRRIRDARTRLSLLIDRFKEEQLVVG